MQRRITEKILLVVSAALFFASIFGWYGSTLPEYYESKTVLTIKPPMISGKVMKSLTEEELEQKLVLMNQEILGDSTLGPMIAKYKLFEVEKAKAMPMELIIEKMRRNIRIEMENDVIGGKLKGFSLTYRDTTPEKTQNIAAELAGKYVNQQVSCGLGVDKETYLLMKSIENTEKQMNKLEKKRSKINSQNLETKYQTSKDKLSWVKLELENSYEKSRDETIRVVDPANLPQSPIFPTKIDFAIVGAGFGFLFGLIVLGLSQLANIFRMRFAELDLQ